jgi:hypothetical protein
MFYGLEVYRHAHAQSNQPRDDELGLAVRKLNDSPLPAPGPLSRATVSTTTLHGPELFVLALGQSDDDVRFAGSQSQNAQTRARAHGSNGFGERGRGLPSRLSLSAVNGWPEIGGVVIHQQSVSDNSSHP